MRTGKILLRLCTYGRVSMNLEKLRMIVENAVADKNGDIVFSLDKKGYYNLKDDEMPPVKTIEETPPYYGTVRFGETMRTIHLPIKLTTNYQPLKKITGGKVEKMDLKIDIYFRSEETEVDEPLEEYNESVRNIQLIID